MKIGFFGLGNMASAIIRGMKKSGLFEQDLILGFDRHKEKAEALQVSMPACVEALIADSDIVFLCVKPQSLSDCIQQLASCFSCEQLVVSIAAGKTLDWFEGFLGSVPVVRVMPNINSFVGSGVSAICGNAFAAVEQLSLVSKIFSSIGTVYELPEKHFSAFSAVAGASPAYTYLYIDALASAAVKAGIPKTLALSIAADAVLGSAKMLQESKEHPAALADRVCSPAGTTIEGLHALRRCGFESAVYQAIDAVIAKDRSL